MALLLKLKLITVYSSAVKAQFLMEDIAPPTSALLLLKEL